jgi:uncharacterized protein YaeQ
MVIQGWGTARGRMPMHRCRAAGGSCHPARAADPLLGYGTVTPHTDLGRARARTHSRMALKATIYKAQLQIADMDRALYADHALTLALHPSETEERLMVRLLAFALQVPADDHDGALQFARGLSDADEPDLWQHALDGRLRHWIEVGLPDERRMTRACARADKVSIYAYGTQAAPWWAGMSGRLSRLRNLHVWSLSPANSQALAALAARSMQLQVSVQDGQVWFVQGERSAEVHPEALSTAAAAA